MGNLHYHRLFFNLSKYRQKKISCKEPFKSRRIPKFGCEMSQNTENIALRASQILVCFCVTLEIVSYHFLAENGNNFRMHVIK